MIPADARLVEQALAGSQDACRALVERHSRAVLNLVARMVRDDGVAEELAQDAFVKAFGALRTFNPAYKFSNWILRIAHNVAIDHLRRSRLPVVRIDDESSGRNIADVLADTREPSAFDRAVQLDFRDDLEEALARLRPEFRRLVVMRYLEDLSYEDIAEVVGLPIGTVKSHLHRARAALGRLLADAGWGPGTPDRET
ncbi:MAG: sigma-70 family RNA polymerase sigma factor [Vicinamibacterales bacterium]